MATTVVERRRDGHLERTATEPRERELHAVRLARIDQVNERIRLFRLELQAGPVKFLPGQWLDTFVPGVSKPGGFTITSAPSAAAAAAVQASSSSFPYLELAVQESPGNPQAAWLWRPAEQILGSELHVRIGGGFVFPPRGLDLDGGGIRRVVFVAGGVGVNPLMGMLSSMADDDDDDGSRFEVWVLYSSKLPSSGDIREILFLDRIKKLFAEGKLNGHVKLYITGGSAAQISEAGVETQARRLSVDDLRAAVGGPFRESSLVYVCGPPTMTDELVATLTSPDGLAVDARCVLAEKWW